MLYSLKTISCVVDLFSGQKTVFVCQFRPGPPGPTSSYRLGLLHFPVRPSFHSMYRIVVILGRFDLVRFPYLVSAKYQISSDLWSIWCGLWCYLWRVFENARNTGLFQKAFSGVDANYVFKNSKCSAVIEEVSAQAVGSICGLQILL